MSVETSPETTRALVETRALRMLRAGDSRKDIAQATGLTTAEIDKLAVDFPGPHQARPVALASSTTTAVVGTIGPLLEQASGHSSKRVQNLGQRIEKQLDDLRGLIASLADDERRRKTETAAKEKARAEITRLEQQLATAKAALRGKPRTSPPVARSSEPLPCRKAHWRMVSPATQRAVYAGYRSGSVSQHVAAMQDAIDEMNHGEPSRPSTPLGGSRG